MQRISMVPIRVNDVVANLRDLLRHAVGNDVRVEIELDPAVDYALCDANQLENALLNLALNARDAMPQGGRLSVRTALAPSAEASDLEPGDYVRLTVSDTGEGMEPEVLLRATEPFFSTKATGKGTGLGLAQVYGIARQSGGTLRIDSKPGGGTTVAILLPWAENAEAGEPVDPDLAAFRAAQQRAADASILIIDDDRDVRAFLGGALESMGYQVREADGGEAGLRQLDEHCPDLVLLDYAMPGMHGAEVARIARKRYESLPIVFVTGYAVTDQLEAALGPDVPVLRKPFSVAQLASTVEAQLAGR
jgi:CheY-like chemotaxis protein/two-component sensor histidine kinase